MNKYSPSTTAVIVNYFSAKYTLLAAKSVLNSSSIGPLKLVVVDNSCDKHEYDTLFTFLPEKTHLIINSVNVGFGKACNQVFERSKDEFFFLLNPDAYLTSGALEKMQLTLLDFPKIGAVSPQAFWDDELSFFIPPAHPPLLFLFQEELSNLGINSYIYRFISRWWRRYSIRIWKSERPIKVSNLCGGHVLLRRDAVSKSGGLFDERFFLYFEDTDLFMRMRKKGIPFIIEPKAKVVHHYDQCDPSNRYSKRKFMSQSFESFAYKYLKKRHLFVKMLLKMIGNKSTRKESDFEIIEDYPNRIRVPKTYHQNEWLFEWSPNPDFIPSVGYFGCGKTFSFPGKCLEKLAPGKYYMRFSDPRSNKRLGHILIWVKR